MSDFSNIYFGDTRRTKLFNKLMSLFLEGKKAIIKNLSSNFSKAQSIYNFFKNPNIQQENILKHHQRATIDRALKEEKNTEILVIQDTTYCNYNSKLATKGIGDLGKNQYGVTKGFCIHNTICINEEQVCLGILDQKIYNHGDYAAKKERLRWTGSLKITKSVLPDAITICDRESDFFEFFKEATKLEAKIIVRLTENRYTKNEELEKIKVKDLLKNKKCTYEYTNFKNRKKISISLCYTNNVEFLSPERNKDGNSVFF